jgi:hemerythrin-like domain-containing protein
MKPRGSLMIEHRLIEKMLRLMAREVESIEDTASVDPLFVDAAVDFIRMYADRTHHGKEEDILFMELGNKKLNAEDSSLMAELVQEHALARTAVKELVKANRSYAGGDRGSLSLVKEKLQWLIEFYPQHIRKEDKVFFPRAEAYFTPDELDRMLQAFWEFDRLMIHEKYNGLVAELAKRREG